MDLRGRPIPVCTDVGNGTMKNSRDRGNARILKSLPPKQKRVRHNMTNGMAGLTAEGLEPSMPYALTTRKRKSISPAAQFVRIGVAAISFLLSHRR
jgi:hypothetical protein